MNKLFSIIILVYQFTFKANWLFPNILEDDDDDNRDDNDEHLIIPSFSCLVIMASFQNAKDSGTHNEAVLYYQLIRKPQSRYLIISHEYSTNVAH